MIVLKVQKIGFHGENVFHGFHGSIVDFTGLAQKQPISRARDTVKKEGPCVTRDQSLNRCVNSRDQSLNRCVTSKDQSLNRCVTSRDQSLNRCVTRAHNVSLELTV